MSQTPRTAGSRIASPGTRAVREWFVACRTELTVHLAFLQPGSITGLRNQWFNRYFGGVAVVPHTFPPASNLPRRRPSVSPRSTEGPNAGGPQPTREYALLRAPPLFASKHARIGARMWQPENLTRRCLQPTDACRHAGTYGSARPAARNSAALPPPPRQARWRARGV